MKIDIKGRSNKTKARKWAEKNVKETIIMVKG